VVRLLPVDSLPMTSFSAHESTSERVTVDDHQKRESDYLIYLFHLATYDFAGSFVADRQVLDYGCGTGYGTHRLASRCKSIVGVDVSQDAIDFARSRYFAENLRFHRVSPVEESPLPFAHSSFDVVLSFQVIEHLPNPDRYLAEVCRLLEEDGLLLLATPDRTSRLLPRQRPWNRYHRVEYNSGRLERLLKSHFSEVEIDLMSGEPTIIDRELRRCRRLKWITLPFTFPGTPEAWRQLGLGAMKRIQSGARRRQDLSGKLDTDGIGAMGGAGEVVTPSHAYPYDQSVLRIAPKATPSVNLVAVARAPRASGTGRT
jgi:SAM-dependent methyltransferase